MSATSVIYNAIIFNPEGHFNGYVCIGADGCIARIGKGDVPAEIITDTANKTDAHGAWLLPGIIDEHVHFRDPGLTFKADIASESRAAAAGGVTAFMDMPNTKPPTTSHKAWEEKMIIAAEKSVINYACWIGANADNFDQLAQADYTKIPGIKIFAGTSTGNMAINGDELYTRIFSEIPILKAVHSEDDATIAANAERAATDYGSTEAVPVEEHPRIRSREACMKCSKHLVDLQRATGSKLQIMHVSTADELQLLSSDSIDKKRLTAETCVQYLWWDSTDYPHLGAGIKCNPAIKNASDRMALLQAVRNGRIDVIATDHAPHLQSDKQGGALKAVSGIPLIQFSLPMMLELCKRGEFSVETVVEKMCHAPAVIFGIERRGCIRTGFYADLVLVSPGNTPYIVNKDMLLSKCGWSPLEGTKLHHKVLSTWVNGKLVWDGNRIIRTDAAMPLRFTNTK